MLKAGTRSTRRSSDAVVAVSAPTLESVLSALRIERLLDLSRLFGCDVHDARGPKEQRVRALALALDGRFSSVLHELRRDELRAVCRRHGLDASSPSRADLQGQLLGAAGLDPKMGSVPPRAVDECSAGAACGAEDEEVHGSAQVVQRLHSNDHRPYPRTRILQR